jgi:hypothetical protein
MSHAGDTRPQACRTKRGKQGGPTTCLPILYLFLNSYTLQTIPSTRLDGWALGKGDVVIALLCNFLELSFVFLGAASLSCGEHAMTLPAACSGWRCCQQATVLQATAGGATATNTLHYYTLHYCYKHSSAMLQSDNAIGQWRRMI